MRSTRMACLLGMTACLLACGDDDDAPADPCGDGQLVEVGGARFCAFREGLVIEGGFRCPADFPYRIDVEGAAVCAEEPIDPSELPEEVCVRIERSCEGPPDAMPPRDTGTGDAGDAGPMDAGPTDAGPDATTDGGGAGTYWTLQPAVTDFFVQAERCSYGEGRTPVVRATIHWFSSCDEPGPIEVAVNDADQTIRMSAWVWRQEGRS
ncbi:MAG: hypothetical protein IT379_11450, partial [Deltaproteobacteria bacterium]|nr:hypothetical protein [Deltaproteobacteria bacterium]